MISKAKAWAVSLITACWVYKCLDCQIVVYNLWMWLCANAMLPQRKDWLFRKHRGQNCICKQVRGTVYSGCSNFMILILVALWGMIQSACVLAYRCHSCSQTCTHITVPHSVSALHSCSPAECAVLWVQLVCVSFKLWRSRSLPSCDSLSILKRGMERTPVKVLYYLSALSFLTLLRWALGHRLDSLLSGVCTKGLLHFISALWDQPRTAVM